MESAVDLLSRQLVEAYRMIRDRVEGLSEDEFWWEPVPDCWSVRQTEEFVAQFQKQPFVLSKEDSAPPAGRDVHVVDLENKLTERFGTKVHLRYKAGRGAIEIKFFSDDELARVLQLAGIKSD